ncbi:MAG: hypothetical protein DRG09_04390 [Epsilonproteobacteria bacterium]|nr:MAG: hypothetical protein DRG09_04390 [Campylobacterota bacterium]
MARFEAKPTQGCEAYNNMKHTMNTHHVILDTSEKYTVLKHHKGQNLILVKGEQPAQRWVDDECFSKKTNTVLNIDDELRRASVNMSDDSNHNTVNENISPNNLLVLSWHNAFCETHRYKKECKRGMLSFGKNGYREKHFVLHGLWPQPRSNVYCSVSQKELSLDKHKQWNRLAPLDLSDEVREDLKKLMPGISSNLHKHEWIKHGTCYGTDANRYYKDAISLVKQINNSKVGHFFKNNIGKRVTLQQVRSLFDRNFGLGTGKRLDMLCKKGLVTELWLHLGSGSDDIGTLLKHGEVTRSRCFNGVIDRAGFGR